MRPADKIDKLIKKLQTKASVELDERVHSEISKALAETKKTQSVKPGPNIWSIIMKSRITKFAAAAVIILIVVFSINLLDKSVTPAYAIEQTIQANHTVRYIHLKSFHSNEQEPTEIWVECGESGQIKNLRVHMPAWVSPYDGAKEAVWNDDRAEIFLKEKNVLAVIRDEKVGNQILESLEKCDPRLAIEQLQEQAKQGKVEIEISQPPDKSEPIVVTALYPSDANSPARKHILFVDQSTRLLMAMEIYELEENEYVYKKIIEYYDYNQEIKQEMFVLANVPDDVIHLEQFAQEIGLEQGDLSDKEIAAEVVKRFFEAIIEENYGEAGRMYQGLSAEKIANAYGKSEEGRFLRVVSMGEPTPDMKFGGLRVPCTIEIEKKGVVQEWRPHPDGILVRPVNNQPNRWTICGGI